MIRRDFLVSNLFIWATSLFTFGLLVMLPLYFESVRLPHLSALDTGLALVPLGVGTIVGTILAAALYRALGPRWVVVLASGISALSAWMLIQAIHPTADANQLLATLQTQTAVPLVAGPDDLRWGMFLVGLSFAMVGVATQTLALEALKGEALAKASSLLLSTKFIFSSIGVAVLTTFFVNNTRSRASDLSNQLSSLGQGAGGSSSDPNVVMALQKIALQIAVQSATWAIQNIFWFTGFGSLALVLLALTLPGRQRQVKIVVEAESPAIHPIAESAL
jgi:hypothetical protein